MGYSTALCHEKTPHFKLLFLQVNKFTCVCISLYTNTHTKRRSSLNNLVWDLYQSLHAMPGVAVLDLVPGLFGEK